MAQEAFAREPLEARSAVLERVAHALVEDAEAITRTIVAEAGKPLAEAYAHELVVGADACRWLAANLGRVLREERLGFPQLVLRHKRGWIRYEPLGVVGIVTPWNFPLAIPLRGVAAAVATGNAAVLKPSELTPLTGAWVEELFRRAGAPAGLVRVVQGPGETTGDALVRHRGVDAVLFTGSVEVGRLVAQAAAERLCPVVLELGGKDAMLVLDDADLDRAVQGALWGTFTNCGQACAGIERIAVPAGLHDTFVERLTAEARGLRIGHGLGSRRRARAARQRGAARPVREPARGRGRARGGGRGRRAPARCRPPGLVLRAHDPRRRAAHRAPSQRGALRPRGSSCRNRQRRRDGAMGERHRPSASERASGAGTRSAHARSRRGSRPDPSGSTTTRTPSGRPRHRGVAGERPASGEPGPDTACTRSRTSSSWTRTGGG